MANKKNDPNHLGFGRLMAWKSSDIAMAGLNVIVLGYLSIRFPPSLNLQWLPPFTYCLFNLLSNTNAPLRWNYLRKSNAANKNGG